MKKRFFSTLCIYILLVSIVGILQLPTVALNPGDGITFGTSQWVNLNTQWLNTYGFTPRYAPYYVDDNLNVETNSPCAAIPSSQLPSTVTGVFLISRDYNTFYVCWYKDNHEVYGYIPINAVANYQNLSYTWTNYDVYMPGTLNTATDVYSGPGGSGTYVVVNNLSGASNILVLGTKYNTSTYHTFYFIQYEKSNMIYRGWVDSTSSSVSINYLQYETPGLDENHYYVIEKPDTGQVLTLNTTSGKIELQTYQGTINQFFLIQRTLVTPFSRIIPLSDTTKAIAVGEQGYYDGIEFELVNIADNHKQQEFFFNAYDTNNQFDIDYSDTAIEFLIGSRSTGLKKYISVPLSPPAGQPNIVYQNGNYGVVSRHWNVIRINDPFSGKFFLSSGGITPINRKVCSYDSLMCSEFESLFNQGYLNVQHSLNMWNDCDLTLNLTLGDSNTNMLAYIYFDSDLPDSVCGKCISFDEFYTQNSSLNSDYSVTTILIDDEAIKSTNYYSNANRTNEEKAAFIEYIITHELGHSLKLTHIFTRYSHNPNSGNRRWLECGIYVRDVLNKYVYNIAPATSVGFNNTRLTEKWAPYLVP